MITSDNFKFLDYWFYNVGANICPADTKNKRTSDNWKPRQNSEMSVEEYEQLKKENAFIRGAAVVTGRVWRGKYNGYYLNGMDFDNSKAIEELCHSMGDELGKTVTVNDLAEWTLVEHHLDNPAKLHLYVYSKHPFKNKSSDTGKAWFKKDSMPAIEVKGTKTLMFCTPSIHKDGHQYQFLNQRVPVVADDMERIIDDILSKYDIEYLSNTDKRIRNVQRQSDDSKAIHEGSRHNELLREINAKLHSHIRLKSLEEIKQMCIAYNNLYCKPPYPRNQFERIWNDSVNHVTEKELEKNRGNAGPSQGVEPISVTEAIRRNSGQVAVKGMIIGVSSVEQVVTGIEFYCSNCHFSLPVKYNPPLFSLPFSLQLAKPKLCHTCGLSSLGPSKYEEKSAIVIQLQDEEKHNALESLNVVLFDDDTLNVRNGEKATLLGDLYVVQQKGNSKRVTYLFANRGIQYERPENARVVITEEDLCNLNKYVQQPNHISQLVAMFAPTVIGHEDKKLAVILMYVGASETGDFRGRIHGLLIGPPGTAKTKLARAAKRLGEPQSRYSSTQGASGRSITAIIDKDNDSYVLRLGVLPQAKNSMCILNEIASLSMEDQRHLFDVMEEGMLTLDKYGFHREIESPTTVLGTTNPEGGEWYMDIVEKGKIPLRKEFVDRYDLVLVFEPLRGKDNKTAYAKNKLQILRKSQHGEIVEDYTFLRKVIEHAKTFNPQLSEEAEAMIIDYWSGLDSKIFPNNRVLETIVRVSIAFARLHFSNEVTASIAKKSIEFITRLFKAFDNTVEVVHDPRDAVCLLVAEFLMKTPNMPFDFSDCVNYAITRNKLVEAYLGNSPVNTSGHKYRDLRERFLQSNPVTDGLIGIDSHNPLRLVFKVRTQSVKEKGNVS